MCIYWIWQRKTWVTFLGFSPSLMWSSHIRHGIFMWLGNRRLVEEQEQRLTWRLDGKQLWPRNLETGPMWSGDELGFRSLSSNPQTHVVWAVCPWSIHWTSLGVLVFLTGANPLADSLVSEQVLVVKGGCDRRAAPAHGQTTQIQHLEFSFHMQAPFLIFLLHHWPLSLQILLNCGLLSPLSLVSD